MANSDSRRSRKLKTLIPKNKHKIDTDFISADQTMEIVPSKQQSDQNPADVLSPKPSKKYAAKRELGHGGMKNVIKVKDRDTTRDLAMARVIESKLNSSNVRRFIREARITAALEHPNIVPIHDIGKDRDGRPYFTMKLLDGETLFDVLLKIGEGKQSYINKYTLPFRLQIFRRICDAINFSHSKGIIHLDLKPANIHISRYGEVLVIDWGLAKVMDDEDEEFNFSEIVDEEIEQTMDGIIKGSPGYMAPEQAFSKPIHKDERTDIYALGSMLYSILTLTNPVVGESVDEILKHTLEGNIIPPKSRAPDLDIPAALDAITMKAMRLMPEARYQSVQELIDDVDAYTNGFAAKAEEAGLVTLMWKAIQRRRVFAVMTLIAITMITAISVVYILDLKLTEGQLELAIKQANANAEREKRTSERLREEKKKTEEYGKLAAPRLKRMSVQDFKEGRYKDSLEKIDFALGFDPSLKDALPLKAWIYLHYSEYDKALATFKDILDSNVDIEKKRYFSNLSLVTEGLNTKDIEKFSLDKFIQFFKLIQKYPDDFGLNNIKKFNKLNGDLFATVNQSDLEIEIKIKALQRGLNVINKSISALKIKHVFHGANHKFLKLKFEANSGLKNLSILKHFPVFDLDLSKTQISNLKVLNTISFDYLTLPRSITSLESLKELPDVVDLSFCNNFNWNELRVRLPKKKIVLSSSMKTHEIYKYLLKQDIEIDLRL